MIIFCINESIFTLILNAKYVKEFTSTLSKIKVKNNYFLCYSFGSILVLFPFVPCLFVCVCVIVPCVNLAWRGGCQSFTWLGGSIFFFSIQVKRVVREHIGWILHLHCNLMIFIVHLYHDMYHWEYALMLYVYSLNRRI